MNKVVVTGGAGFMGSNFIRHLLRRYDYQITNIDKLTYAGNLDNLRDVSSDARYSFVRADICDPVAVAEAVKGAWAVVNIAAETHVDRSLMDAGVFIDTDVRGTFVLLDTARKANVERFLHVSTDEVYGPRLPEKPGVESDPLMPANPYAASKAAGEQQVMAAFRAYGQPVIISRNANNIGPYQHVEKAVPLWVTNALDDQPVPIYGDGLQVRDRIYIEDNCEALDLLLHEGVPGETYNVSAGNERTNLDVAETILRLLAKPHDLLRFVPDRTGHDARYSVETSKIAALGWRPRHTYETAMEKTVYWYRDNRSWWERIKSGEFAEYYKRQYADRLRLGVRRR
jgi:dTDP-glucose 4,6-dehydratase